MYGDPNLIKVMSPVLSPSSAKGDAGYRTLKPFDTDIKSKQRYRNALQTCMNMMIEIAEGDKKAKDMVHVSRYMIFLACDRLERDLIRQAQRDGSVSIKGGVLDVDRSILVSLIIDVIEKDKPTEVVRREVAMLTDIQSCMRYEGETPAKFSNCFSSVVTR